MGWALLLCFIAIGSVSRTILAFSLPGTDYITEVSFVLTTMVLTLTSIACLWVVHMKQRP